MNPQRVTLITLGVHDLEASRAFYEALGWKPVVEMEGTIFYQLRGQGLALWGARALADDQKRPPASMGTGMMTLAQNFADREAVDAAYAAALAAGAAELKAPEPTFWGGYSGYYADPDGHVWEVAHNPFWPLDEGGGVTIPAA